MLDEDDIYFLDRRDRDAFRELVQDMRTRERNRAAFPYHDPQDYLTPEVYIARVPADGIPALDEHESRYRGTSGTGSGTTDSEPGSAECNIYFIEEGGTGTGTGTENDVHLRAASYITRIVWNISSVPISGDAWILVARDKFGRWLVAGGDIGGVGTNHWVKVTSSTAVAGYYPGLLQLLTGIIWSNTDTVRVVSAGGDTFIPNKRYLCRREGRKHLGYQVYTHEGVTKHAIDYCDPDTGEDKRDMWFIRYPFSAKEDIGTSGTGTGTVP